MPLTIPQLDDRNAQQLVSEVIARIPVHTPEWNNFNHSDPGMTLVQLFAFMTENLLYRANRVPENNRKKFLKLLGIGLRPPSPGHGLVVFDNERGPVQVAPLPKGMTVRAGSVPFQTRHDVDVLPVSAQLFYKEPRNDLSEAEEQRYRELYGEPDTENVYYQTMPFDSPEVGKALPELNLSGNTDTIDNSLWMALLAPRNVPVETVRREIGGQTLSIGICPALSVNGITLEPKAAEAQQVTESSLNFEIAAPADGYADTLAPPNYKPLRIEYAEDVLNQPGVVRVTLPTEEISLWDFDPNEEGTADYPPLIEDENLKQRIVTWLRITRRKPSDEDENRFLAARLTWVGVNAVRVVQAVSVKDEQLGVGNNAPSQVYKVTNTPVIIPEPEATDTCKLKIINDAGDWVEWRRIDDLYAAESTDSVYMLDPESGEVHFGDGIHGKRPPLNQRILISYEYGGGTQGKLAIGAINKSMLPGGFKVSNPLPTWRADSGETTDEGERRIASYLRHRERLVTIEDFRTIAASSPGVDVGRVEVLPLFNPSTFKRNQEPVNHPGAVTVMVIPETSGHPSTPPVPDRLFLDTVCDWLDPRRLATTEVFVRGPQYIWLWVTIGIITMPGQMRARVRNRVEIAIRDYLSPLFGGLPPADQAVGSGWPLGMEIRTQDIEAVAVRVDGVRYVEEIKMGMGNTITEKQTVRIAGIELPWLVNISVDEGKAPPLDNFRRRQDADSQQRRPVPTIRRKC